MCVIEVGIGGKKKVGRKDCECLVWENFVDSEVLGFQRTVACGSGWTVRVWSREVGFL